MMEDEDVSWLEEMAYGVADAHVRNESPPPPRSPVAGAEVIRAPPLHAISEAGVEIPVVGDDLINVEDLVADDDVREIEEPSRQQVNPVEASLVKGKRKADVEKDGRKGGKKHKSHKSGSHHSGSSRHHRSLPIDEGFVRRNYEEYVADPISATVNVTLYLADLVKAERETAEVKLSVMQKERDNERSLKEAAWVSLSETRNSLLAARESLTTLSGNLKVVEKLRDDLAQEKEKYQEKITELKARIEELEGQKKVLILKEQELNQKVSDLEALIKSSAERPSSSADSLARLAEMEAQLKAKDAAIAVAEEKAKKTAQLAMKMRDHGFQLALKQVQVINPAMSVLQEPVLQPYHSVEDGKIVSIDRASKVKTVIYPPQTN